MPSLSTLLEFLHHHVRIATFICSRLSSIPRVEGIESGSCRIAPFVQAYFEKFHPDWPFLYPAMFGHTHEPGFLLQSVVMIGCG